MRVGRDANKVQLFVEINPLNDLVRVPDLPMLRSVSCEEWHRELQKPDQSPVPHEPRGRRFRRNQFVFTPSLAHVRLKLVFCRETRKFGTVGAICMTARFSSNE